ADEGDLRPDADGTGILAGAPGVLEQSGDHGREHGQPGVALFDVRDPDQLRPGKGAPGDGVRTDPSVVGRGGGSDPPAADGPAGGPDHGDGPSGGPVEPGEPATG